LAAGCSSPSQGKGAPAAGLLANYAPGRAPTFPGLFVDLGISEVASNCKNVSVVTTGQFDQLPLVGQQISRHDAAAARSDLADQMPVVPLEAASEMLLNLAASGTETMRRRSTSSENC
jgi:hypothetical protein